MWNDEDNNPYGQSFARGDTSPAGLHESESRDYGNFDVPETPSTTSDHEPSPHARYENEEAGELESDDDAMVRERGELIPRRKPGGYDSRIEQILYENPELPILIVDAGKSLEGSGRYIVYTIRTQDLEVRRRYSEFDSLREALIRLHPTLVIPPIPDKHTIADYAANPTNAKNDQAVIDQRKRMLAVFLNRCRRMEQVRTDGVWWRFLDPNASWNEVLHSHPIASIPKSVLKAPPLDTANPTEAHMYLPVPSTSAKLKAPMGTQHLDTAALVGGAQVFGRFPPDSRKLSEQELDPYFISFEASIKELEHHLKGPMEQVNRRIISHLRLLATDLCELGSRYNGFALSEPSASLAPAIERVGQAADSSYIATSELYASLGASFAEPMRENAQFAGVVRNVLRYRDLKRVQQEMTNDELAKKKALLMQLEHSEAEARRIDQYLSSSQIHQSPPTSSSSPRRASHTSSAAEAGHHHREGSEDTESFDSDFPPTHAAGSVPSAAQGGPERTPQQLLLPPPPTSHKKVPSSGNSITNKIFAPIRHAFQGVADVDPERNRRDLMGKTRESIAQLEEAQVVAEQDVKDASGNILQDLKRFQGEKEDDLRRYMLAYARSQVEWAKKNKETWEEAKAEIEKIDED